VRHISDLVTDSENPASATELVNLLTQVGIMDDAPETGLAITSQGSAYLAALQQSDPTTSKDLASFIEGASSI
jgi:hypothetical protein